MARPAFLALRSAPTPLFTLSALLLLITALSCSACQKKNAPAPEQSEEQRAPSDDTPQEDEDEAQDSAEESSAVPGLGEGSEHQQGLLLEAKKAFLSDDITRAEALFETLADSEPTSGPQVSAVIALAQIYIDTDRADEALSRYQKLDESVGELPEIQLIIARALAEIGESSRAISAYQKLLEIQPDFVFAHLELGKLYAAAGREDDAAKSFYEYEQKIYKLAELLEAPDTPPAEQIRVLNIFSLVSDDRASEATIHALTFDQPRVREQAAIVLGQTGAVEAIPALKKMEIEDPDPTARIAARGAIKALEDLDLEGEDTPLGPTIVDDQDALPLK